MQKQVYNALYYGLDLGGFGLRTIDYGADAVVHVATSVHLGKRGGHLFSDASGTSFTNCGVSKKMDCGSVSMTLQPLETQNAKLGAALFKWTKTRLLAKTESQEVPLSLS